MLCWSHHGITICVLMRLIHRGIEPEETRAFNRAIPSLYLISVDPFCAEGHELGLPTSHLVDHMFHLQLFVSVLPEGLSHLLFSQLLLTGGLLSCADSANPTTVGIDSKIG